MYIERDLEKKIQKYLKRKEIIAIAGARQCGKTTLVHHVFSKLKNKEIISFDDQEILNLFSNNIKLFIELYVEGKDYLFIDEFQYAKQGGKQLKYIYDTHKIKIFISGSSSPDLAIHGLKYLVGRVFLFNLYPLSFTEFLRYKNRKLYNIYLKNKVSSSFVNYLKKYYDEFIIYGGYPNVVLAERKEVKIEVLKGIYDTYFLREIREILQLPDNFKLIKLIKLLALQIGNVVNYSELSSSLDMNHFELMKNLNVLNQTFICIEAKPFFTNKKKELIKSPEFFFLDNGFRNLVVKNFNRLDNRSDFGYLHENFVASEIVKKDNELMYWRTKVKAEVDFILEKQGEIIPIEVKSHLKTKKITRSFRNFLESYKPKKGFIFSEDLVDKMKVGKTIVQFNPIFCVSKIF